MPGSAILRQRLDDGDADNEERDAREDEDEDEKADPVVAPEAPLGFHHWLGVEGYEDRSHGTVVAEHRTRIEIDGVATEPLESAPRLLARERRRHLGKGLWQDGPQRRSGRLDGAHTIEERQTLPGLTELHEQTLEGRAAASGEGGLGGFR